MTKEARKNLIRTRYLALFGVAISGLMPVSTAEIAQEARAIVKNRVSDTIEEEEMEMPSQLSFDSPAIRGDKDSEILLSETEKARLTRDVDAFHWQKGKARGMWLVVV
jgi:hypothetical protein